MDINIYVLIYFSSLVSTQSNKQTIYMLTLAHLA